MINLKQQNQKPFAFNSFLCGHYNLLKSGVFSEKKTFETVKPRLVKKLFSINSRHTMLIINCNEIIIDILIVYYIKLNRIQNCPGGGG